MVENSAYILYVAAVLVNGVARALSEPAGPGAEAPVIPARW